MLIVDAHQDLAWNILTFDRDYTLAAVETRQRELGTSAPAHNGDTLLGWPDYQPCLQPRLDASLANLTRNVTPRPSRLTRFTGTSWTLTYV